MKKVLNIFFIVSVLFISFFVFKSTINAVDYGMLDGNVVIDRINSSKPIAQDLIVKLNTWSNTYGIDLVELMDNNLIDDIDVNSVISSLRNNGYDIAADDLELVKNDINNDIDYLKETINMAQYYIDHDLDTDMVDEEDIYYNLRSLFRYIKPELNNLLRTYHTLSYNKLSDKVDNASVSELEKLYDEYWNKVNGNNTYINKLKDKLTEIINIYSSHDLEIYEDIIKDEFRSYYETFKTDYDKLYSKLETRLQNRLDEKIDEITIGVNKQDALEVETANNSLLDISDKIEEAKTKTEERFNSINNYFNGVNMFDEYITPYENKILNRLQQAIDYVKSKLLSLDFLLKVKNDSDKKNIGIDHQKGLIIYNTKNFVPSTLINKLFTNLGTLKVNKTYNNKVGTKSLLDVVNGNNVIKEYIIIVKGDINPNGNIDITDLVNMCDKIFGIRNLDSYQMIAADFDNNGNIDITDLVNLCDRIYE